MKLTKEDIQKYGTEDEKKFLLEEDSFDIHPLVLINRIQEILADILRELFEDEYELGFSAREIKSKIANRFTERITPIIRKYLEK